MSRIEGARGTADGSGPCDVVTVAARQGLEAVDILRLSCGVGPVLHDGTGARVGFVVPPGTADGWDVPGSACTPTDGRGLARALAPDGPPPAAGTGWLVPPRACATATDPAELRAALGAAARTLRLTDALRTAGPDDPPPHRGG